jgi:hypothetical protein
MPCYRVPPEPMPFEPLSGAHGRVPSYMLTAGVPPDDEVGVLRSQFFSVARM